MNEQTGLIKKQTALELEQAYKDACEKIKAGYALLSEAQNILDAAFGQWNSYANFDVVDRNIGWYNGHPEKTVDAILLKIKRGAWGRIIDGLEVRKVLSEKRARELDNKLEDGKSLPEISAAAIFDILQSFLQNAPDMQKEVIEEAWNFLRPRGSQYKTVDKYQVGKKVILSWIVEIPYGSWRVIYSREAGLIALDRAFALLDGAEVPGGYKSPLIDAINTSKGKGETEYFGFTCYENRNLHLTFKRPDLVAKLNAMCGGMNLKGK